MLRAALKAASQQNAALKCFHTSSLKRLREIVVKSVDEKTTVIEAKYVESPRIPYLLKVDDKSNKCPLCKLQLDLKHTDVLILNQYVDSVGRIIPHPATHLCKRQYKLVKELIHMAQYAGLLPEPPREEPRRPYECLNTYYDEKTINLYPKNLPHEPRFHYLKLGPIEKGRVKPERGINYKEFKK